MTACCPCVFVTDCFIYVFLFLSLAVYMCEGVGGRYCFYCSHCLKHFLLLCCMKSAIQIEFDWLIDWLIECVPFKNIWIDQVYRDHFATYHIKLHYVTKENVWKPLKSCPYHTLTIWFSFVLVLAVIYAGYDKILTVTKYLRTIDKYNYTDKYNVAILNESKEASVDLLSQQQLETRVMMNGQGARVGKKTETRSWYKAKKKKKKDGAVKGM